MARPLPMGVLASPISIWPPPTIRTCRPASRPRPGASPRLSAGVYAGLSLMTFLKKPLTHLGARASCLQERPPQEFPVYQAVIWDFGGVFTSSPFEAFTRYERDRGLPENLIRQINSANPLENAWARFERSELDLDGFDEEFAKEARVLGHHVPGKDIIALLAGDFRPEMIAALKTIKEGHKTGCITNNVPSNHSGSRAGRALYAREIMEMFDHVIELSKIA